MWYNRFMKKVYVGCALMNLPPEEKEAFLARINELKSGLRSRGYDVIEFLYSLGNGTPEEIYTYDIHQCVGSADAMLAVCDYPSLGLGYEMATAIEKRGIPVLAVAHESSKVSSLIQGITHPNFTFERYGSLDEVVSKFDAFIRAKTVAVR